MAKLIKMIGTKRYEVILRQDQDEMYFIEYENREENVVRKSELLTDFMLASYLFDVKVTELEGN